MSEPTTETGRKLIGNRLAHLPYCAVFISGDLRPDGSYACGCNLDDVILTIEAEARADADAQVAALRAQLTEFVTWATEGEKHDGIVARGKAVIADTTSAAKAHDEALVKPWREWIVARDAEKHVVDWACGECITEAAYDRSMIVPGFRCIPHQARALLRDTE